MPTWSRKVRHLPIADAAAVDKHCMIERPAITSTNRLAFEEVRKLIEVTLDLKSLYSEISHAVGSCDAGSAAFQSTACHEGLG